MLNSSEITSKSIPPQLFLLSTTTINIIFSFLILKILSFTILVIPFFILISFILLSVGALSTQYLKKNISNTRTLIFQLGAVILLTTFLFTVILGNTQVLGGDLNFSFSRFIIFFFLYIVILAPFYLFWGRIEYIAFKLFISNSEHPSIFYIINLLGILLGIFYDFLLFRHVGILGTIVLICFVISVVILYKHRLFIIISLSIIFIIPFNIARHYENDIIHYFLSEKDQYNYKNNIFVNLKLVDIDPENYRQNYKIISQGWNKYCHYTLVQFGKYIFGAYNGYLYWFYPGGINFPKEYLSLENFGMHLVEKGGNFAIIGSGGGIQAAMALPHVPRKIYAIEIIPNVIKDLAGKYSAFNDHLYKNEIVVPVSGDGKHFIENSSEKFNLIMSVNTESFIGFYKDLFEPSQLLHTYESFRSIYEHLNDGGIFSIKKIIQFDDSDNSMFYNYFYTLQKANFIVRGYINYHERSFLLLGFKKKIQFPELLSEFEKDLISKETLIIDSIPTSRKSEIININNLYLGGILYYITGKTFLFKIIALIIFILLLIIVIYRNIFKNKADLDLYYKSFLIGLNFILIEYLIIYKLRIIVGNPLDAYYLGLLFFTTFAIIGNFIHEKYNKFDIKFIILIFIFSILTYLHIFFIIPLVFLTGIFFKELFINYENKTLQIFLFDLIGMTFGGIMSLLMIYSCNFYYFMHFSIVVFFLTLLSMKKLIFK